MPFSGRPVSSTARVELAEAAHTEGALLTFPDPPETVRLLRVTAEAEQRNRADADRSSESRRWLHPDVGASAGVGLPDRVLGPQDARERIPMRDFTAQRHPERLPSQDFETTRSSPCSRPNTTGAPTGCAPARHWNTCCWWPPPTVCARPCCTSRWSGSTCGVTSAPRPITPGTRRC